MSEWISIEDRLPEPKNTTMRCLVNVKNFYVCIDVFVKTDNTFNDYMGHVTHWMPLPEPPTE